MTAKELAQFFGYSESSIVKSFVNTQRLLKKNFGVNVIKNGPDNFEIKKIYADYFFDEDVDKVRILKRAFKMDEYAFMILMMLIKGECFNGHIKYLMKYLGIKTIKSNKIKVINVLNKLNEDGYIQMKDLGRDMYEIEIIKQDNDEYYEIDLKIVKNFYDLIETAHIQYKTFVDLIKYYIAAKEYENKFYVELLRRMTGFSDNQLRIYKKLIIGCGYWDLKTRQS